MLGKRRRRWANICQTLGRSVVFAGIDYNEYCKSTRNTYVVPPANMYNIICIKDFQALDIANNPIF